MKVWAIWEMWPEDQDIVSLWDSADGAKQEMERLRVDMGYLPGRDPYHVEEHEVLSHVTLTHGN